MDDSDSGNGASRGFVTKDDVIRKLKYNYSFAQQDPSNRVLDTLVKLVNNGLRPGTDLIQLLNEVARMINKHLQIRATTIGIKDPRDGRYRYVAMSGLNDDQWHVHKTLSYTLQEFFDPVKYKGTTISDFTKVFLAEDRPYDSDEIGTFNPKLSNAMVRRSPEDANEGDYIDVYIYGPGSELLGWIEITGTTYGRLPDVKTIRWIEAIATVLGLVLTVRGYSSASGKR